jgi:hypothetical protein
MRQMHGGVWDAIIIIALMQLRMYCAIIRIMPQIHDGMLNTGAPQNNHAALLKVRVLAPSSGLCIKFMTELNTGAPHHSYAALLKVRVLAPSSGSCYKVMTGCGLGAPHHNHEALLKVRCLLHHHAAFMKVYYLLRVVDHQLDGATNA